MSERLLGAVVGMHGDDNGLILPPSVAPFQVILMPVAAHADDRVTPARGGARRRFIISWTKGEDRRPGRKARCEAL